MDDLTRIFAVRIGNHVEFRRGPGLRSRVSKLTKTSIKEVRTVKPLVNAPWYKIEYKQVPHQVVLKQVFWEGGKVLAVCPVTNYLRFRKRFGLESIKKDQVLEVPKEFSEALLNLLKRRTYDE